MRYFGRPEDSNEDRNQRICLQDQWPGLHSVRHLAQRLNRISPDWETRHRAVAHLTRCVEALAAMGSKLLAGRIFAPIGYLPKHRPKPEEWSWAVQVFQALRNVLEANDVVLAIELVNRSETFFIRTAAEATRLCELIGDSRIGITIDAFHANIEEQDHTGGDSDLMGRSVSDPNSALVCLRRASSQAATTVWARARAS